MSVRTGPYKTLLAATTIASSDKTACTNTFQAKGNSLKLYVTTDGALDTVTFSAAISPDGTNYFDVEDLSWTVEASGATTAELNLDGLSLAPLDYVKIYYQCESTGQDLTIKALNFESSINGSRVISGLDAVEANQTDGSQKTQIVDGSGNVIGSTGGALDVNISSGATAGGALETTQLAVQTAVEASQTALELIDDVVATEDSASPTKGLAIVGKAATSQRSAVADGDSIIITTNDHGEIVLANTNWTGQYLEVAEQSPIDEKGSGEIVCNVENATDGTFDYYVDISNYRSIVLQSTIDGGSGSATVTIDYTGLDDGTAAASIAASDWKDISQYGFDNIAGAATAASYTASFALKLKEGIRGKFLRIKVVANTTGANDADFKIIAFKSAI